MDLLTALSHEIGHLLGLEHDDGGVMNETLDAGSRETPFDDLAWFFDEAESVTRRRRA